VSEEVNRKCRAGNTMVQLLAPPTPTLSATMYSIIDRQTDKDKQTETERQKETNSRPMYIPECSFLAVKHFTFQLITFLIHPI